MRVWSHNLPILARILQALTLKRKISDSKAVDWCADRLCTPKKKTRTTTSNFSRSISLTVNRINGTLGVHFTFRGERWRSVKSVRGTYLCPETLWHGLSSCNQLPLLDSVPTESRTSYLSSAIKIVQIQQSMQEIQVLLLKKWCRIHTHIYFSH